MYISLVYILIILYRKHRNLSVMCNIDDMNIYHDISVCDII